MRLPILLASLAGVAGCGPRPVTPAPSAVPAAPVGEVVENPEYANWSRFPVGTTVTRRAVARRGDAETVSVEQTRLVTADGQSITLERRGTTTRSDGSLDRVNPPDARVVAKSFALPSGMSAADFAKPNPRAKLAGTEDIEVAGKRDTASIYQWEDGTEAGPMRVRVWFAPEFPGRVLKQSMTVDGTATTTTETVESVTIPAGKNSPQVSPHSGR